MNTRCALRWLRVNLFANVADTVLTLTCLPLCVWTLWAFGSWAVTQAQWQIVTDSLRVLMIGTFPMELSARAWGAAAALLVALAFTLVTLSRARHAPHLTGRGLSVTWLAALICVGWLLEPASSQHWGGLLMSVLMTLGAAALSIPLGVALAFGRHSRFVSARLLCTGYIEVMRALPLILVIYWVWIVTPMLVPGNAPPDLLRGLLAFSFFYAAYVAEYVRSGLQAVPRGQIEAAQSLGLSHIQVQRDVVLPQALRVITPALAGNVLDIFNNVPLLFIIGLTDFFRAGQMVLVNPESGGRSYEIYLFLFAVYLLIASLITFGTRRLEHRMAIAHR